MRNDCKAAYELYKKNLMEYALLYPYQISRLEDVERLQYTRDEKYFQYRREFNGKLMRIFTKHRDKNFVIKLNNFEREHYFALLQNIERNYFEEAVILERSLIDQF